jgi:hypothetical protein
MRSHRLPFNFLLGLFIVVLFLALHVALAVWLTRAPGHISAARSTAGFRGCQVVGQNPRTSAGVSACAVKFSSAQLSANV